MTPRRPIPYGRQEITEEDIRAVTGVLRSDFLTQGPAIDAFEEAFAAYVGSRYAVAVANGTAALHLGAMALGVSPGSKVITTPMTFAASANCVRYCGGEVVFSDIDPVSYTLDPAAVRALVERHPKGTFAGLIPVDYAGLPAHAEALRGIADEHGLWILEDACHAPGATFRDSRGVEQRCGNGIFSELTVFSFHPVKHIATGEGGMITTNDEAMYRHLRTLRTHGITRDPALLGENHGGWYYEMIELGYNYRLTDIQAALGISQLSRADTNLQRRRDIAARYQREFADLPIYLPVVPAGREHAWHLYVIQTERRKELYDALREDGIYSQVHYIPVHLLPYYRSLGWKTGDMPVAERHYQRCLSLPMFPSMTEDEQRHVIDSVRRILRKTA